MSLEEMRQQRLNIKNMQNVSQFQNNREKQAQPSYDSKKLSIEEMKQMRMNMKGSGR